MLVLGNKDSSTIQLRLWGISLQKQNKNRTIWCFSQLGLCPTYPTQGRFLSLVRIRNSWIDAQNNPPTHPFWSVLKFTKSIGEIRSIPVRDKITESPTFSCIILSETHCVGPRSSCFNHKQACSNEIWPAFKNWEVTKLLNPCYMFGTAVC